MNRPIVCCASRCAPRGECDVVDLIPHTNGVPRRAFARGCVLVAIVIQTAFAAAAQESAQQPAPAPAAEQEKAPEHIKLLLARMPDQSPANQAVLQGILGALNERDLRRLFGMLSPDGVDDAAPRMTLHAAAIVAGMNNEGRIRRVFQETACALLGEAGASDYNRRFLVAQLQWIADDTSVPCLRELLSDAALADAAAGALGAIRSDAALDALIQALPTVSGGARQAVIAALGASGSPRSVDALRPVVRDPDPDMREAALAALAEIGVGNLHTDLNAEISASGGGRRARLIDLVFRNALRLSERDERQRAITDVRTAAQRYGPADPGVRVAALRAIVAFTGADAVSDVVAALNDDDPDVRRVAVETGATQSGDDLGRAYAGMMPRMRAARARAGLVRLLGLRDDAPVDVLVTALDDADAPVRIAALEGLARHPSASAMDAIIRRLAVPGREQELAIEILTASKNEKLNAGLVAAIADAEAPAAVGILRVLLARSAPGAKAEALKRLDHADADLRGAALEVVRQTGNAGETPALIERLRANPPDEERAAIESAIIAVVRNTPPGRFRLLPITGVIDEESAATRASLLRVLGRIGGAEAATAIRKALEESDPIVRDGVVDAILAWESTADAMRLFDFARHDDLRVHAAALRSLCRLTIVDNESSADDRVARLYSTVGLARRSEEKSLAISGLGAIDSDKATGMLVSFADQEETRDAAIAGLLTRAEKLAPLDWPRAAAALKAAEAAGVPAALQPRAASIAEAINAVEGFVFEWRVAGPYAQRAVTGGRLHDTVLPPEQAAPDAPIEWRAVRNPLERAWALDFNALFGQDHAAAYAECYVYAAAAFPARIEVGADDGLKLWINGELALSHNEGRSLAPAQHVVAARLNAGWNRLLFKVSNRRGGWGLCARIRGENGEPIPDLRLSNSPPEAP